MSLLLRNVVSAVLALSCLACSPYRVREHLSPHTPVRPHFEGSPPTVSLSAAAWWKDFGSEQLNQLVEATLRENFSLKAAWSRLEQAEATIDSTGSAQYPQLQISSAATRNRSEGPLAFQSNFGTYQNNFLVQSGLSFELDVWQRLASQTNAARRSAEASRADVESLASILVGSVVENWFQLLAANALEQTVRQQIETNQMLLELTELRFAVGRGNALDVLQQRTQLANTRAELPLIERSAALSYQRLAALTTRTPSTLKPLIETLPAIPALPSIATPASLLEARPDLRAIARRTQAAEYSAAAIFAERFPALSIGFDYSFQAEKISDVFDATKTAHAALRAADALYDGGARRARLRAQEARVEELLASYSDTYLQALREVEGALSTEQTQRELLRLVEAELGHARQTLGESQSRYSNGLSDYLQVIIATQTVQRLERRIIQERLALLIARSTLYRSLGAVWATDLTPDGLTPANDSRRDRIEVSTTP